ncbi:ketopantoate reductase family protein [Herbaspirillum sp. BH-1]|uniref:2-dehydropantoate 2-reductase n=1 Tax=Herbaspirillum frisingense TaxID=92645 RepID=A0ABU1PJY4_9BURK|nr:MULTISPECIES: ketopantoate reductase family protein [Herbaspirillum]MDR6585423.1 2-dehydropantoate 2-reductase [Herbaspirillum frisingense]PLY59181.1 ketopantoate reductase family protein [Herbaspirillum sp. BH-1]
MKILVLGAGAMGGYYGARLIEAGQDVSFLVRERRARQLQQEGLVIDSALGNFAGPVKTLVSGTAIAAEFDLILLACKSYDLDGAIETLKPLTGQNTVILPILNGLSTYDSLDATFGRDRILGGVSYIATTLDKNGHIQHQGSNDSLSVGARASSSENIARAFHAAIARTPGLRQFSDNIDQALWNKWAMIAAGAAVTCLMRGNIGQILATAEGESLVRQAITETTSVAGGSGYPLPQVALDQMHKLLLSPASTWEASMARDIAAGMARLEADAIIGDMLTRARQLGIELPLLRAAYCHLQVYELRQAAN